jgi:Mn2+/Fe2+ NRAMP family transporter
LALNITKATTIIINTPKNIVTTSIIFCPLCAGLGLNAIFGLDVKIGAAITAVLSIAIFISKSGQKIPAMLPILKARPPIAMRIDINVPSPLKISLATSCPRLPVTTSTRQILICAPISIYIYINPHCNWWSSF